ncbi:MAG: mechanosensitive ion channel [Candidatus Lokiarchaeota archaeon]|nr:mechanosensitive ion channel [Candidatus Lokiarchaeota archaeon]
MKKKYYLLIYLILTLFAILVIYLSTWTQVVKNLILINIIVYIIRKPLISITAFITKKRSYRTSVALSVTIIWGIFLFWFLIEFDPTLFFAIVPFLVVAVSLNFKNIINNIVSGALLLSSDQFEIGDLIETNEIQGIVKEINLNYMKIREFDGVSIVIPNSNVYGFTTVKFTHNKFKIFEPLKREEFRKKRHYREYLKLINKILTAQIKTTTYVKKLELLGSIDPNLLDEMLMYVFKVYEPIFGIIPDYAIDTTRFERVRIMLYVKSSNPTIILNYIDSFLRDILFTLYPDRIYRDWEKYQQQIAEAKLENEGDEK